MYVKTKVLLTPGRKHGCDVYMQRYVIGPKLGAINMLPPLLSPSISCISCEQNNIMDVSSVALHQLPLSEARPPSGCEQMSRMFNSSFCHCRGSGKKTTHNWWTWLQDSDDSFSGYLWVEADVWDGGRLVVRLVPEGAGLVEVAPQLWETHMDYC